MELAVGSIVTGKVTTITKFGAFVALPDGKSGLVHISEVAATFVNDVHDFLTEGQEVQVKILSVNAGGEDQPVHQADAAARAAPAHARRWTPPLRRSASAHAQRPASRRRKAAEPPRTPAGAARGGAEL